MKAVTNNKQLIRVKQVASGKTRLSATAEFEVPDLNIEIIGDAQKLADVIEFNQETMYELYDRYGNLVRKGSGKTIEIKGLERNFYYLNYDNKSAKTVRNDHTILVTYRLPSSVVSTKSKFHACKRLISAYPPVEKARNMFNVCAD